MHEDPVQAEQTVQKMKAFDAHENVFVIISHDPSLIGVVDFFPGTLNSWKDKQWAQATRWRFLDDFADAIAT